jgi:hypothetical protein
MKLSYWFAGFGLAGLVSYGVLPATDAVAQGAKKQAQRPPKDDDDDDDKVQARQGVEKRIPNSKRWQVSWAVDPDVSKIRMKPVPTEIAHLLTFKRPAALPKKGTVPVKYRATRVAPVETTVYSIEGTVISACAEHDGDYRLIVADSKGNQVTCVMPEPDLAPKRSKISTLLDAARKVTAHKFQLDFKPTDVSVPVKLSGIGYFGRLNSDANKSPEGFQLHPVIAVEFPGK